MQQRINIRDSIARVECNDRRGTGFLVSFEGHLITCAHIVKNPRDVKLFFLNEEGQFSYECSATEIYYCDKSNGDFCLLKVRDPLPERLVPVNLYDASQSIGNNFITYGFAESNPLEGLEGKGTIQNCNLRSESGFPIIQLEESNSINQGFSGSLIFDTEINGVIGLVHGGVIDKMSGRQLGTSFGVPINYVAEKCIEDYVLDVKEPKETVELPDKFLYLQRPKSERISPSKIRYQDYLQSNNLPYYSRDAFQSKTNLAGGFITESHILQQLESEEGGIIFGEGGVGKTRLMYELGQMALKLDWVVIIVKPDAPNIEILLKYMVPQYKYLLLFDYIEDSQCFNGDIISTLLEKNEKLTVKALANCRKTFQISSKFPKTYLQFEIKDNDAEKRYRDEVTQGIIQDLLRVFNAKNQDFFGIKPSFAVFLRFLWQKEQLDTDDIREVKSFKRWIKKRFRLTFNKEDYSELDEKFIYLLASLPVKDKMIDKVYESGFRKICQRLKNDGWIEETDDDTLKVIHDTIVDELLMIHLEIVGKDINREITEILNFSVQFQCQTNWLRSMERIIEKSILKDSNCLYNIIDKKLKSPGNDVIFPLKYYLLTSPVLDEKNRILLISNHTDFFREDLEAQFFGIPLSFALNKERNNKDLDRNFREVFSIWYDRNQHFYYDFSVAYRVLSTYIKKFGLDDFTNRIIGQYLEYHCYKSQTSFVLQAWFDNGGDLKHVRDYVLRYLERNAHDENAQYVLAAWLKNGNPVEDIQAYVFEYLETNIEEVDASFVLTAWLNNGNPVDEIQDYVLEFLKKHSHNESARFLLVAWLNSGNPVDEIQDYVLEFLKKHSHNESARFLLVAWLNNDSAIEEVRAYVLEYLETNIEEVDASFVLTAWLNNGNPVEDVHDYMLDYLKKHSHNENAQFVLTAWLDTGNPSEHIQEYLLRYLKKNTEAAGTSFVLEAWLNNGGAVEEVRDYVITYLKKNTEAAEISFVLDAWLNNGHSVGDVRDYVLAYLGNNVRDENVQFVLATWLKNGHPVGDVWDYVVAYLEKNAQDENAQFVLVAWLNNGHSAGDVWDYVLAYLENNAHDENARFLLAAWLNNEHSAGDVRGYVLAYLEKNAQDENAQYVLAAWLNNGHSAGDVRDYMLAYLEKNAQDENAQFVLAAWLNNEHSAGDVRGYVLAYLEKNAQDENAQFVLAAWLKNGHSAGDVRGYVLAYLEKNAQDENAQFVLAAWLKNGHSAGDVRGYVLAYLEKNAQKGNARFVLAAWLNSWHPIEDVEDYVLKYLEKNEKKDNASYVFQAWFYRKGDLNPIKEHLLKFFGKNADLKSTGYHFGSWIKLGGSFMEIEPFVIQYLRVRSSFPEASFIINAILRNEDAEIENFREYIINHIYQNIASPNTSFILGSWIERTDKPTDDLITDFLNKNIENVKSQIVLAKWILHHKKLVLSEPYIKRYLKTYSAREESQHVFSAWLKSGGNLSVIEPFVDDFLNYNSTKENTGYFYTWWLNQGGPIERIKEKLQSWLRADQPASVLDKVYDSLVNNGFIQKYLEELFE